MGKTVVIAATLDTKGEETELLRSLIAKRGHRVMVADTGILGSPCFDGKIDIDRDQIAEAGGSDIATLKEKGDEALAQRIMGAGLKKIVLSLAKTGRVDGFLALGGGQGSVIVAPTLKALGLGFPKLLVSTKVTQAGLRPYIGSKDVVIVPPVADLAGINRLTRRILFNAAGAMAGMVEMPPPEDRNRPLVVMSMNGTVTDCGLAVKEMLEDRGYAVLVFHTIGTGGEALEEYVKSEEVAGVIELAVNEITNEFMGGLASAGPDRLTAAGNRGIPQLVVPGSADFINFLGPETVPSRYRDRNIYSHNPQATLVRTEADDNVALGKTIARKLNRARGPVAVIWPGGGLSTLDRPGRPYRDPVIDEVLLNTLRKNLKEDIAVSESDAHINDEGFAREVFEVFMELIRGA